MHKLLLIGTLSAGLFFQASAQGTFNKRFDLFDEGGFQDSFGVLVDSLGKALVIFGGDYYNSGDYYSSGFSSVSIDSDGNYGDGYRFIYPGHATYLGWYGNLHSRIEGGYIVAGSTFETDTIRVMLYWINDLGEVEQYREYELPGVWIGRQARQLPDGGYVVVGEDSNNGADGFLMRTNAAGDIQWLRTYGASDNWDFINSVIPLPEEQGYLLGGTRYMAGVSAQLWALRVDTSGTVVWERTWGSVYDDGVAHLVLTQNGELVVSSGWGTDINAKVYPYLAGLDVETGEVLWSQTYAYDCPGCTFYSAVEDTLRGGIVSVGDLLFNPMIYGMMLRTSATGDSLLV